MQSADDLALVRRIAEAIKSLEVETGHANGTYSSALRRNLAAAVAYVVRDQIPRL